VSNAHKAVGLAINGVVIDAPGPAMTRVFDTCMGHVNTKHSYHYHLPPKCLFEGLDIPTPVNTSYWLDDQPFRYGEYWPQMGPPSPIVGYALDGFPIMGPYDSNGNLMLGTYHPSSTLDQCNGKEDTSGRYRYYWTPTPPYVPCCFRGSSVGFLKRTLQSNSRQCSADGRNLTFVEGKSALGAALSSAGADLFSGSCSSIENPLLFLFPYEVSGLKWEVCAWILGVIWLSLFVYVISKFWDGTSVKWRNFSVGFLALGSGTRSLFFFIDPFYMRKILPPHLVGYLYGMLFPSLNCALGLMLLTFLDILLSIIETLKNLKAGKKIAMFLPRFRWLFGITCFFEFTTQLVADTLRAEKYHLPWLIICQIYFIIFGFCLCGGYVWFSYTRTGDKLKTMKKHTDSMKRVAWKVALSAIIVGCLGVLTFVMGCFVLDEWSIYWIMLAKEFALITCVWYTARGLGVGKPKKKTHSGASNSLARRISAPKASSSNLMGFFTGRSRVSRPMQSSKSRVPIEMVTENKTKSPSFFHAGSKSLEISSVYEQKSTSKMKSLSRDRSNLRPTGQASSQTIDNEEKLLISTQSSILTPMGLKDRMSSSIGATSELHQTRGRFAGGTMAIVDEKVDAEAGTSGTGFHV